MDPTLALISDVRSICFPKSADASSILTVPVVGGKAAARARRNSQQLGFSGALKKFMPGMHRHHILSSICAIVRLFDDTSEVYSQAALWPSGSHGPGL